MSRLLGEISRHLASFHLTRYPAPPESCGGFDRFNQLRDHFSSFYIMDQVLAWYRLYEKREQLSEDELYELKDGYRPFSTLLAKSKR